MLSRRQFLVGAVTVLAAASGCRKNTADPSTEETTASTGPQPFRIALLSDTHTQEVTSLTAIAANGKLMRAVSDLSRFRPDLWVCNGDVSDHGLPGEYAAFRKILGSAASPDQLLVTTGNHEFYDKHSTDQQAIARFCAAFGLAKPYTSRVAGGIHLILLADEQWKSAPRNPDWAWLSPEQLRWFEQVLQEQRDRFTVVFLHQPIQDTVLWSWGGNNFGGCGQAEALRAILSRNPQVKLWFSGHTHIRVELPGQTVLQRGVTFTALGSTFYQYFPSESARDDSGWPGPGGFRQDLRASQTRVMEVWPDRVVVRTRDHARRQWVQEPVIMIPRASDGGLTRVGEA